MNTDLISYLMDKLKQWDALMTDLKQEVTNTHSSDLREYYICMMHEIQSVRDEIGIQLAVVMAQTVLDRSYSGYFIN